jgi:photosystem II stability/assembly factor-like uncharacterized protein
LKQRICFFVISGLLCFHVFALLGQQAIAQWTQGQGTESQLIKTILPSGKLLYAGALGGFYTPGDTTYVGGVFRSRDGGATWEPTHSGLPSFATVFALANTDSGILAGTDTGVYLSRDSGASWSSRNAGIVWKEDEWQGYTPKSARALLVDNQRVFLAAGNAGVFVSTNAGKNWVSCNEGFSFEKINALGVFNRRLLAGSDGPIYFNFLDSLRSWNTVQHGPIDVRSFVSSGALMYASSIYQGVFRSIDSGRTWESSSSGLTDSSISCVDADKETVVAGSTSDGFFLSTDNGESWRVANSGLVGIGSLDVYCVKIVGADVFVGKASGVWRRKLSDITASVVLRFPLRQSQIVLQPNYPNPFNPSTSIRFSVRDRGHVSLEIYDAIGAKVATLVDGQREPGAYVAVWNAAKVSSGIYVCRLTAGNEEACLRLLCIR